MTRRLALVLLLLAVLPGLRWLQAFASSAQDALPAPRRVEDPRPANQFTWVGAGSCAASACHGNNAQGGILGSEYTFWITSDPHRKAYEVLFSDKSARIIKNLQSVIKEPAHRADLCLSCHVHPGYGESKHSDRFTVADGVGCESCHGPASNWVGEHYRTGWSALSTQQKADRGMYDTKSIAGRSEACVKCHVGTPENEVNHDLIAAGHPRLNFEFGAYHAYLPHHWSDAKDKQGYPDFEARAWALGQIVSAQAAMKLLRSRAHSEGKPWPEFAEYDCYACHHDLKADSWRQRRDLDFYNAAPRKAAEAPDPSRRRPGAFSWSGWYLAMPRTLASWPSLKDEKLGEALNELEREMNQPYPSRQKIVAQVNVALEDLRRLGGTLSRQRIADAETVSRRFALLSQDPHTIEKGNWDNTMQLYLGLAALYHAEKDFGRSKSHQLTADLKSLADFLRLPEMFDHRCLKNVLEQIGQSGNR